MKKIIILNILTIFGTSILAIPNNKKNIVINNMSISPNSEVFKNFVKSTNKYFSNQLIKVIKNFNNTLKETKQQKLKEISDYYQTLSESEKKSFKESINKIGFYAKSVGILGCGLIKTVKINDVLQTKKE